MPHRRTLSSRSVTSDSSEDEFTPMHVQPANSPVSSPPSSADGFWATVRPLTRSDEDAADMAAVDEYFAQRNSGIQDDDDAAFHEQMVQIQERLRLIQHEEHPEYLWSSPPVDIYANDFQSNNPVGPGDAEQERINQAYVEAMFAEHFDTHLPGDASFHPSVRRSPGCLAHYQMSADGPVRHARPGHRHVTYRPGITALARDRGSLMGSHWTPTRPRTPFIHRQAEGFAAATISVSGAEGSNGTGIAPAQHGQPVMFPSIMRTGHMANVGAPRRNNPGYAAYLASRQAFGDSDDEDIPAMPDRPSPAPAVLSAQAREFMTASAATAGVVLSGPLLPTDWETYPYNGPMPLQALLVQEREEQDDGDYTVSPRRGRR